MNRRSLLTTAGLLLVLAAACGSRDRLVEVAPSPDPRDTIASTPSPNPPPAGTTTMPTTPTTPTTTVAPAATWEPTAITTPSAPPPTTLGVAPAIQLCRDVPLIESEVVGDDPNGVRGDPLFDAVLFNYANEHRSTFGGMWLDRAANGTTVLAFTDDPEVHRAAIAQRRPSEDDLEIFAAPRPDVDLDRSIGDWGKAFDVVQVTYTQDEIIDYTNEVGQALDSAGLSIGLGGDPLRNLVGLYPERALTIEEAEAVAEVVAAVAPADAVCLDADIVEDRPASIPADIPLDVIVVPEADGTYPPETEVECGRARFTLAELRSATPLAEVDPGLEPVVEDMVSTILEGWPPNGWVVLTHGDRSATIAWIGTGPSELPDDDGLLAIEVERGPHGWRWSPGSGGGPCPVLTSPLPPGVGEVEWTLDPAVPVPDGASTELRVLVEERACASGTELGDRLLGPQVVETDDAVRIAVAAIPLEGDQTCQGNPSTPIVITLGQPLGERIVLDGLIVGAVDDLVAAAPEPFE